MIKGILIAIYCFTLNPSTGWQTNFEEASKVSSAEHKPILLNFSGSDWCGPCIRMRKEIFEMAEFMSLADSSLVLLNADFPRSKKNRLSDAIIKQNENLAEKYNPDGKFPLTVLIDEEGKVLHSWDGLPANNLQFIFSLKEITDAYRNAK